MSVYLLMRSDVWGVDDYPLHAFFVLPGLSELKRVASEFIEYHGEEFIATEETLRDGYSKGNYYCQVSSSNYYLYLCEIPAS